MNEYSHGSNGSGGVHENPAKNDHDLIPPPLQANRDAARRGEPKQRLPAAETVSARGGAVQAGEANGGSEEEEDGEVGSGGGSGDTGEAEAEARDEEVVEGEVEEGSGEGG